MTQDVFQTGQQNVQGAAGQGQSAINSFNPTDIAGTQRTGFNNLFGSQVGTGPQNATDYMKAYSGAIAANPTVTSLYNTGNKMFNVPQLANQATYLQNQVTNVAPNQYQLARGFDVSEPQVENAINTNLRFLQPQATAATNQAQTAQNLANQYVQSGIAQNQFNLLPIQSYQPILQQALAAQATGWTQTAQNEFAGLQAKMNAGVQLSEAEMQQYTALAQAQADYNARINTANIANQFKTIPQGQNLVNTFANTIMNPSMLTAQTGMANYG